MNESRVVEPSRSVYDLYRLLGHDPKNVALSPLSLKLAFGILQPGASVSTKNSLEALFGLKPSQSPLFAAEFELLDETLKSKKSFNLSITNSIWLKDPKQIHAEFKKSLSNLRTETHRLQLKELNAWVEKATNGKITQLIDKLPPTTQALALNTLYLHALWSRPFSKDQTVPGRFQPSPHATKVVPLMHQITTFRHQENQISRWVELPYRDTPLVMWIGLPKKRFDLQSVESKIGPDFLKSMEANWKEQVVDLVLPRFSVKLKQSLQPLMKEAGFGDLFVKGAFPKVMASGELSATDVIQAVSLDVREEGTEAAAATAVMLERSGFFGRSSVPFFADEPFLFLLVHPKSGEVYFMGRMSDPTLG
jgi:serpin B